MDFAVVLGWWRTADILKIEKKRDISVTMLPIAANFGTLTRIGPLHPIRTFENQDLENGKTTISRQRYYRSPPNLAR